MTDQFKFRQVAFFGRGIDEYVAMFNLDLAEMHGKKVLDCPGGPAAFAYQAAERGISVVACDPLYKQDPTTLRSLVDFDADAVAQKQQLGRSLLHRELVPTSERRKQMEIFLNDFNEATLEKRYVPSALPSLPFADAEFDMVLSANLLFLYSDPDSGGMMENSPFDYEFHSIAIKELLRLTAGELRIYPLNGVGMPDNFVHEYLPDIMAECRAAGYSAEVVPVAHRDIIGAEKMLRVAPVD